MRKILLISSANGTDRASLTVSDKGTLLIVLISVSALDKRTVLK